jgi:hypothetical protein
MSFREAMEAVSTAFELVGVAIFALGALLLSIRIVGGYLGARLE